MNKKLSFVIPLFNEEKSLPELYKKLVHVLKLDFKNYDHEIIFVNDGSTDSSLEIIKGLSKSDPSVRVISFRRHLGKATAINIGFRKALGEVVVTMDADLQDGPENLPKLMDKLNEGYDLVVGWKKKRFDPFGKTFPSKVFNFFIEKFFKIHLHDVNSGFRIMKGSVNKELHLYGELHRFIPVLVSWKGFKVSEVPVAHHPRKYGSSKYGGGRFSKGFFDFLTVMFLGSYGQRPLHLFGLLGSLSILLGTIFGLYLTVIHFMGESISRRPLLILAVLLVLAGLQLLSIGLIAEMIVSSRPDQNSDLPIDYEC